MKAELERLEVIDLRPTDLIIATVSGFTDPSPREVENLRYELLREFPDNQVLVLLGVDVKVARPA